jgi:hypothetical protein
MLKDRVNRVSQINGRSEMPIEAGSRGRLKVVHVKYLYSEPFHPRLFEGFSSLRVLTYSGSISRTVRMLHLFQDVECIFGYERALGSIGDILAFQKVASENLYTAIKGLADEGKCLLLDKVAQGNARCFLVKEGISHAKLYLLEGPGRRRVIVGSANMSEAAFSGTQDENILVFDNDDLAWEEYSDQYEAVKQRAGTEMSNFNIDVQEVALEDVPLAQEVKQAEQGLTLYIDGEAAADAPPTVVQKIVQLAGPLSVAAREVVREKGGKVHVTAKEIGAILRLVQSKRLKNQEVSDPSWLSIFRDTGKVIHNGKETCILSR